MVLQEFYQKSALPLVSCRGHPRRLFNRPNIQSWNLATRCGAYSASGCLAGEFERIKTQPFHPRRDHQIFVSFFGPYKRDKVVLVGIGLFLRRTSSCEVPNLSWFCPHQLRSTQSSSPNVEDPLVLWNVLLATHKTNSDGPGENWSCMHLYRSSAHINVTK
jgi:hypothetical protein